MSSQLIPSSLFFHFSIHFVFVFLIVIEFTTFCRSAILIGPQNKHDFLRDYHLSGAPDSEISFFFVKRNETQIGVSLIQIDVNEEMDVRSAN